ncbi:MAG: hypothetical protein Q8S21_04865 [Candidatus Paracaedibacteraceae bacterium]|nr:hypothetical protein [Candidatus Paracaedibacteraceae bacterium]
MKNINFKLCFVYTLFCIVNNSFCSTKLIDAQLACGLINLEKTVRDSLIIVNNKAFDSYNKGVVTRTNLYEHIQKHYTKLDADLGCIIDPKPDFGSPENDSLSCFYASTKDFHVVYSLVDYALKNATDIYEDASDNYVLTYTFSALALESIAKKYAEKHSNLVLKRSRGDGFSLGMTYRKTIDSSNNVLMNICHELMNIRIVAPKTLKFITTAYPVLMPISASYMPIEEAINDQAQRLLRLKAPNVSSEADFPDMSSMRSPIKQPSTKSCRKSIPIKSHGRPVMKSPPGSAKKSSVRPLGKFSPGLAGKSPAKSLTSPGSAKENSSNYSVLSPSFLLEKLKITSSPKGVANQVPAKSDSLLNFNEELDVEVVGHGSSELPTARNENTLNSNIIPVDAEEEQNYNILPSGGVYNPSIQVPQYQMQVAPHYVQAPQYQPHMCQFAPVYQFPVYQAAPSMTQFPVQMGQYQSHYFPAPMYQFPVPMGQCQSPHFPAPMYQFPVPINPYLVSMPHYQAPTNSNSSHERNATFPNVSNYSQHN